MQFSSECKALIKNSCQFKEYGSRRILREFLKMSCRRERLGTFLKRFGKHEAPTKGTRAAQGSDTWVCTQKNPVGFLGTPT